MYKCFISYSYCITNWTNTGIKYKRVILIQEKLEEMNNKVVLEAICPIFRGLPTPPPPLTRAAWQPLRQVPSIRASGLLLYNPTAMNCLSLQAGLFGEE